MGHLNILNCYEGTGEIGLCVDLHCPAQIVKMQYFIDVTTSID